VLVEMVYRYRGVVCLYSSGTSPFTPQEEP
jgi:hypothetical protein